MKHIFLCFLYTATIFLFSCNNEEQANAKISDTTSVSMNNNAENPVLKEKAYRKIDLLEQLFGNENYLLVNGKDSSFLYFTRLGKLDFFSHSYKLSKGDSTQLSIDTIYINNLNQLQWNFKEKQLILQDCNDIKAQWQNKLDANDKVDFLKTNGNRFNAVMNGKQYSMTKTPSISLFLVRARYDFEHHTHYAFDTTNFTKKH